MPPSQYTRIVLAERPKGPINEKTFRKEVVPFDLKPGKNEVLLKTLYLSMDPTQRTWLNDVRGYMKPVQIGEAMRAGGIGVVVQAGEGSRFRVGEVVFGMLGGCSGSGVHVCNCKGLMVDRMERVCGVEL